MGSVRRRRRNSSLGTLPPDLLVCITEYLEADSISLLYGCGNQNLNWALTRGGGVKKLNYRILPKDELVLPFLATYMSQLRSLQVNIVENLHVHPFRALNIMHLSPQLRILHLKYSLGSIDFSLPPSLHNDGSPARVARYPHLAHLFPNLESFHLIHRGMVHHHLFLVLPASLLDLHIQGRIPPIASRVVSVMPKSLQKLALLMPPEEDFVSAPRIQGSLIDFTSPFIPDGREPPDLVDFPPYLSHFTCDLPWALDIVHRLPNSVTHLDLFPSNKPNLPPTHVTQKLRGLPQALTSLSLPIAHFLEESSHWLPESLTSLKLFHPAHFLSEAMASTLPRALRSFNVVNATKLSDESISRLPRVFERLLDFSSRPRSDLFFQSLPTNLTSLEMTQGQLTAQQVLLLPQPLTRLYLSRMHADAIPNLPQNLLQLRVYNSSYTGRDIAKMPATLSALFLLEPSTKHISSSHFKHFEKLDTLHLQASQPHTKHEDYIFPKTISNLEMECYLQFTVLKRLETVCKFRKLTHLRISRTVINLPDFPFEKLPKTLLSLDCGTFSGDIDASTLKKIPKNLTRLTLHAQPYDEAAFTYKDLSLLPQRLVTCHLPGSLSDPDKCYQYLPQAIKMFSCGNTAIRASPY